MNAYLIPGLLGLLMGLLLHWGGFSRSAGLRAALGLRRSLTLRTALTSLGWGVMLTALLMWLAVIDVDQVEVLPLSAGALLGGAVFGVCAGLCGFTPVTAFAGLGAGNAPEALCVIVGCCAGAAISPALDGLLAPLHDPWAEATLFAVTLDEPHLLSGGFLGLSSLGALLAVWGMCIPSPRIKIIEPIEPPPQWQDGDTEGDVSEALPTPAADADSSPADESPDHAPDPAAETVVAALEGEEPLIVDTALDEAQAQDAPSPEDDAPPED